MKLKDACSLEEKLWQTQCIKKQRYHFADKGLYNQSYGFSSSQARMWELDHKEGWVPKNWCLCFLTVLLEKTLESPLDTKDIKSVNPKGNRPWIFHWRTEAAAPILWPCDAKTWLIGKDPAVGEDWRAKEKREAEDETVRQHHQLDGHKSEQTPEESERQVSLACCNPWGCKELDTTKQQ